MTDRASPRAPRDLAAEFHSWIAAGEIRLQRCADCATWRHLPRLRCPACGSEAWEWCPIDGAGTVFSWTTTARPMHPDHPTVPFTLTLVTLVEGPRVLARFAARTATGSSGDPSALRIGLPVIASVRRHVNAGAAIEVRLV